MANAFHIYKKQLSVTTNLKICVPFYILKTEYLLSSLNTKETELFDYEL